MSKIIQAIKAKKIIKNSMLMYELVNQEYEIDITYSKLKFGYPSTINSCVIKAWKNLDGDVEFLTNELNAIDKCNPPLNLDTLKNNNRYFLTSLLLHNSIVNKEKLKV
jgi:hypothetical protein